MTDRSLSCFKSPTDRTLQGGAKLEGGMCNGRLCFAGGQKRSDDSVSPLGVVDRGVENDELGDAREMVDDGMSWRSFDD